MFNIMFNEDVCILTQRDSFSTFYNVFVEEMYFWIYNNLPFSSMFRTDVAEAWARAVKLPGTDDLDCQAGPEMQTRMRRRIQAVDRPSKYFSLRRWETDQVSPTCGHLSYHVPRALAFRAALITNNNLRRSCSYWSFEHSNIKRIYIEAPCANRLNSWEYSKRICSISIKIW